MNLVPILEPTAQQQRPRVPRSTTAIPPLKQNSVYLESTAIMHGHVRCQSTLFIKERASKLVENMSAEAQNLSERCVPRLCISLHRGNSLDTRSRIIPTESMEGVQQALNKTRGGFYAFSKRPPGVEVVDRALQASNAPSQFFYLI